MRRSWTIPLPLFCAAVLAAAAPASHAGPTTEPSTHELLDRIRALEAEVRDLKAHRPETAPVPPPPATQATAPGPRANLPTDAAADAVLRDAERRSRLVGAPAGFTAGYLPDRGFILRSEDGNFLFHPWAYVQVRNTTTYREDGKRGTDSDLQSGFELRRAKFILDGNAFSPDLTYQFVWATDRKTGGLNLEEGWVRYQIPNSPFAVRAGQIRDPLDHEQIIVGSRLFAADRSLADDVLAAGEGTVQGVSLGYARGPVRAEFAVSDGLRSANTNFQDFPTTAGDWGVAGRVEYKVTGSWEDYRDFTALGDAEPLLVFGAGADYTEAGDTGSLVHVADVDYEGPSGLSLYAAYLGRYVRHNGQPPGSNGGATGTGPTADTYDATFRAQAGYVIDGRWEPFVRYEYLYFDPAGLPATVSHSPVHALTAGVNYYLYRHRAKFTADMVYLPNGSPVADDGAGILANRGEPELLFRAQFQLAL